MNNLVLYKGFLSDLFVKYLLWRKLIGFSGMKIIFDWNFYVYICKVKCVVGYIFIFE